MLNKSRCTVEYFCEYTCTSLATNISTEKFISELLPLQIWSSRLCRIRIEMELIVRKTQNIFMKHGVRARQPEKIAHQCTKNNTHIWISYCGSWLKVSLVWKQYKVIHFYFFSIIAHIKICICNGVNTSKKNGTTVHTRFYILSVVHDLFLYGLFILTCLSPNYPDGCIKVITALWWDVWHTLLQKGVWWFLPHEI